MICANYKELIIPEKLKNPNLEKALAWFRTDSWKDLPLGRTEINGPGFYVLRSSYMSMPRNEPRYESHRLYADIQMSISGADLLLVCLRDGLNVVEPYSAEKDIDFLDGEPEYEHEVVVSFPLAVLLFPWDVHKPRVTLNDKPSQQIEKLILKIAL